MHTLQSSLYAFAIFACLLCLWFALGAKGKRLTFLIIFLLLESLGFVFEWLMLHPGSPGKALWLSLFMATSLFVAPCLWLFAREITETKTPSLRLLPLRHFLVLASGLLLLIPLLQTVHWGTDYFDPGNIASTHQSLFIHGTMLFCVFIFLLQVPYYLSQCVQVLLKYTAREKVLFSHIESKTFNTLRLLIWVVCANWLVGLLRTLHCFFLGKDAGLGVFFVLMEVVIALWALITLLKQATIFSFDDHGLVVDGDNDMEAACLVSNEAVAARYAKSSLDAACRARIVKKLNSSLIEQESFRDNRLSLHELCRLINESPHYVSQVINQDFATNFYDLINNHRINYAKSALQQSPDKAIIDIALDAGYNSKSTFNAAFRRYTSMTPTHYRRAQLD